MILLRYLNKNKFTHLSFRFFFWNLALFVFLLVLNWKIMYRFSTVTFALFILLYFIFLWAWLFNGFLFNRNDRWRWMGIPLGIFIIWGSVEIAYCYYYVWLPRFNVVFFVSELGAYRSRFYGKAITANMVFILMAIVDQMYWDRTYDRLRISNLSRRLNSLTDSKSLSAHFVRSLVSIVRRSGQSQNQEVIFFFQYIIDNISRRRVLVPFEEEWVNVKRLIKVCTFKKILIENEDDVPEFVWNITIPVLIVLTWLENAIQHSPEGKEYPIIFLWIRKGDTIALQVRNVILQNTNATSTGQGVEMVNRLLSSENIANDIVYEIIDDNVFAVTLNFKL